MKNKKMTLAEKKAFRAGMSSGYNKGKQYGFALGLEVQENIHSIKGKRW